MLSKMNNWSLDLNISKYTHYVMILILMSSDILVTYYTPYIYNICTYIPVYIYMMLHIICIVRDKQWKQIL